jgi:hypothetical protein
VCYGRLRRLSCRFQARHCDANTHGDSYNNVNCDTHLYSNSNTNYNCDAHLNADCDRNDNTKRDSQFDANSDAELYTQADSICKTTAYAQAKGNPLSSAIGGKQELKRSEAENDQCPTSNALMIRTAVSARGYNNSRSPSREWR